MKESHNSPYKSSVNKGKYNKYGGVIKSSCNHSKNSLKGWERHERHAKVSKFEKKILDRLLFENRPMDTLELSNLTGVPYYYFGTYCQKLMDQKLILRIINSGHRNSKGNLCDLFISNTFLKNNPDLNFEIWNDPRNDKLTQLI